MRPPSTDKQPSMGQSLGDIYEQMARLSAMSGSLKGFHQQTLRSTDARLDAIQPRITELEKWLREHMTAGEPRTTEFEDKAREYLGLCYERRRLQQAQAVSDESLAELEYQTAPREEDAGGGEVELSEEFERLHPRKRPGPDGGQFVAKREAVSANFLRDPQSYWIMPALPQEVLEFIGAELRPLVLKAAIVRKNHTAHKDLEPADDQAILEGALYHPDLLIHDQPAKKPDYWAFVKRDIKGKSVLVELSKTKDRYEIVNWHYISVRGINQKIKRAGREGGHILITESREAQGAAGLSALTTSQNHYTTSDEDVKLASGIDLADWHESDHPRAPEGGEPGYEGGEFIPKAFAAGEPRRIPLSKIEPNPNQPRKAFQLESLQELAKSIKEQGLLQPITVVPRNGGYMIVAGERRWRAANLAGLQEIDTLVREDLDDKAVARLALLENITRADLTPMEEARGYKALYDLESGEEGDLTESERLDELTKVTGRSLTHVKRKLSLLNLLPEFQILIEGGQLPETYGWEIARLDSANQNEVLRWIGKGRPTIEDLRARVSVLLETQESLSIFGEGGGTEGQGTKIHGNVLKQAKERYEKAMDAASRVFRDLLDQETYKVLPVVMEGRLGYQRSRIHETVKALERIDKQMAHAEQFRKKHGSLDKYLEGQTIKGVEEKSKERAKQAKADARALKSELQEARRAVRETRNAGGRKYNAAMRQLSAVSGRIDSAPRAVQALVKLADEDLEMMGLADVEALMVWDDAATETVMLRDADGE